jgi:1-pyrroline-5-carboxylate dehydrogenase
VDAGKKEGDRLLGEDPGDPQNGYFVSPTIFAVEPGATVAREEIFGPVLSVLKARDFDDALKLANDSPYGLTGGVYSKNRDHLERARREFKAGNVYFNRGITGALVGVQPFGGFGMSGTDSKAGGPDYLRSTCSQGRWSRGFRRRYSEALTPCLARSNAPESIVAAWITGLRAGPYGGE